MYTGQKEDRVNDTNCNGRTAHNRYARQRFRPGRCSKLTTGNQTSPEAIAAIHYGSEGKMIWIFYHTPSVTDSKTKEKRHIFNGPGALQPDGTIWRLGADFVTVLHTDVDLDLGGLAVPKGEYALYIDLDQGNWKLIVNKQLMDVRRGRPLWGIANRKGDTTNDQPRNWAAQC
jgi:hypothetical protein